MGRSRNSELSWQCMEANHEKKNLRVSGVASTWHVHPYAKCGEEVIPRAEISTHVGQNSHEKKRENTERNGKNILRTSCSMPDAAHSLHRKTFCSTISLHLEAVTCCSPCFSPPYIVTLLAQVDRTNCSSFCRSGRQLAELEALLSSCCRTCTGPSAAR